MRRLRIGLDMDGVVADFNHGWIERYNRDFEAAIDVDDVVEWDAPTQLTHFGNMSRFWEWARTCGEGRSVFRWLRAYPGSVETVKRLAANGFDIVVLTTKPDFAVDDTYAWLKDQQIPAAEVFILDEKATVECDIYLDDADHNVESFVTTWPDATVCRFVRPWNNPVAGAVDVHGWPDFERVCSDAEGNSG